MPAKTLSYLFSIFFLLTSAAVSQGLQVIGNGPQGPICAGPRGPGPCAQVQQWIMTHPPSPPVMAPLPPRMVAPLPPPPAMLPPPPVVPVQAAPSGPGIEPIRPGASSQEVAFACARARGVDVAGFVECTGAEVILQQREHSVLDCAVSSRTNADFALCAATNAGITLNSDQRVLANCAMKSDGEEDDFISCASSIVGNHLTPQQRQLLNCAADASSTSSFASCAAKNFIGSRLTKEQVVAVECAADSGADFQQFATCAGTRYLNMNLNPEQRIAVQCVVTTGGQPYAAGGCMVSQWTARELQKCFQHGFGGSDGCFGDNNELVGRNGWLARTFGQIAGGPNSVVHNPSQIFGGPNSVFNNPSQLAGGPNSIINNPRQIFGGPNSVINNPGQITGGPNSVINNPGQITGGPNSIINNPGQITGGPNSVINNPGQLIPKIKF
jgi:hypothetical protein